MKHEDSSEPEANSSTKRRISLSSSGIVGAKYDKIESERGAQNLGILLIEYEISSIIKIDKI